MRIKMVNKSNIAVSWYCYNSDDTAKWTALFKGSGGLAAWGGTFTYEPPENSTGKYYVRFAKLASLEEIAGCYTQGQEVTFEGTGGKYKASA